MILMDDALIQLNNQGIISYADVLTRVDDPEKLKNVRSRKKA
jgi:Tfp pilus assembly ATPase PilU